MSFTFEDRIAVVTGAGRGIGKIIAEKLAENGVHVVCVSKSQGSCGSAAEAIQDNGGSAQALAVDVSNSAAVVAASEALIDQHGAIDILVNNAGITRDTLLLRMADEDWDTVLRTNLSSCFYWTKNLLRPMTRKRWGRIINISSVVAAVFLWWPLP